MMSCKSKVSLTNTEFSEGRIFLNGEVYGTSTRYKFSNDKYEILQLSNFDFPTKTNLVEEGMFTLKGKDLILEPRIVSMCQISGVSVICPCENLGSYEIGYKIDRDTIASVDLETHGFIPRKFIVEHDKDGLILKNVNTDSRFSQIQ